MWAKSYLDCKLKIPFFPSCYEEKSFLQLSRNSRKALNTTSIFYNVTGLLEFYFQGVKAKGLATISWRKIRVKSQVIFFPFYVMLFCPQVLNISSHENITFSLARTSFPKRYCQNSRSPDDKIYLIDLQHAQLSLKKNFGTTFLGS